MKFDRRKVKPRREIQQLLVRCYHFLGDVRNGLYPGRFSNSEHRAEAERLLDTALALESDLENEGVEDMGFVARQDVGQGRAPR